MTKQRAAFKENLLADVQAREWQKDNGALRTQTINLQSEIYGLRLANKYLDKELAGRYRSHEEVYRDGRRMMMMMISRIQQLQLLGRNLRGREHDNLWNQLEAEIQLHRQKTVVRACRDKTHSVLITPSNQVHQSVVRSLSLEISSSSLVAVDESCTTLGCSPQESSTSTGHVDHRWPRIQPADVHLRDSPRWTGLALWTVVRRRHDRLRQRARSAQCEACRSRTNPLVDRECDVLSR